MLASDEAGGFHGMSQVLVFALEQELFALPLGVVREVLRSAWPLPLPGAPFACLGALDLHGELVPLLDTAPLLRLRRPHPRAELPERMLASQVLVVQLEDASAALLVDAVLGLGERDALSSVPGQASQVVVGVASDEKGQRALLLEPRALVGARRQKLLRKAVQGAAEVAP